MFQNVNRLWRNRGAIKAGPPKCCPDSDPILGQFRTTYRAFLTLPPTRPRHEGQTFEKVNVLFILQERAVQFRQ